MTKLNNEHLLKEIDVLSKEFGSQIRTAILPCNKMNFQYHKKVGLLDSKLMGKPYWPKDKEYPRSTFGVSMTLLAQINCEHVILPLGLPNKGLIQIFAQESNWLFSKEFKVVYHAETNSNNLIYDFENEVDLYGNWYHNNYKIDFIKAFEIPDLRGMEFENHYGFPFNKLEKEVWLKYHELSRTNKFEKIGNYSYWVHNDVRADNILKYGNYIPIFQMCHFNSNPHFSELYLQIFIDQFDLENLDFDNVLIDITPNN